MQRELDQFFAPPGRARPRSTSQRASQELLSELRREVAELRQRLETEAPFSLEDWFDHKHHTQPFLTLKEIAARSGYSYGYVRRKHAEYLAGKK